MRRIKPWPLNLLRTLSRRCPPDKTCCLPMRRLNATGGYVVHRAGAGLVTLRGACNGCASVARYKVLFVGNISVPIGGTAGAISVAISIGGEAVPQTTATATPAAVGDAWNVETAAFVDVPRGCCANIAVSNISTQAIDVANANLMVERVA